MSTGKDEKQNPQLESPTEGSSEPGKPEAAPPKVEAPQLAPGEMEPRIESWMEMGPSPEKLPEPVKPVARKLAVRARRFTPLAAALTLAAALGGMAGSLAATSLVRLASPAPAALPADDPGVKHTIVRIENELAALRASIETAGTTTSAQFDRISERLTRGERAQAEPASRLVKISDALDRIERRSTPVAASASEATGTVAARGVAAPPGPTVLDGWMIRRARNGVAIIQGRLGVVEVETGDSLPGLGRIEEIKKRDGRWVVVTSRGIILER